MTEHEADDLRDLVISALSKVIFDECPTGSIIEAVEIWQPLDALTPAELDAVKRYFNPMGTPGDGSPLLPGRDFVVGDRYAGDV